MRLAFRGLALAGVIVVGSAADADVTLQNDGFVSGGQALAQGGFVTGEAAASRFDAPDAGRQLLKVQVIYAPDQPNPTTTFPTTLKVYDDTAGNDVPGAELYSNDFQLVGSSSALQEMDVSASNVIVPQQFRVGLVFQHDAYPSVTRDNDGTIHADKNFILANGVTWVRSQSLGLQGDWIIRAVINGGATGTDAGVTMMPDASTVGATCTGNAQCSVGEFCDTSTHACTFDCRTSADCGGGTCNSLGMCVGGTKSSGGGCCEAGRGGEGGIVLGLGVLGLIVRRRRRA